MSITTSAWLILAFPLAGSLACALLWNRLPTRGVGVLASSAIGLAFVSALITTLQLEDKPEASRQVATSLWNYFAISGIDVQLGIFIDPLSMFMCLVVSGVSFLIHVYSTAYMKSDKGYARYFSYLNFFVFSMLLLVLAGNFVLLIVGWAFVGFASYALISFWYRRTTATTAGMKAFVINVAGDVGLVLAAILILRETGVLDYEGVFSRAPEVFTTNEWTLVAICLLIMVGAFAKSAQVPLHTWLPDAMEGPTPVSALIHAATMVTAGVYLIGRCFPLFQLAPTASDIGVGIGAFTLVFAATVAMVMTDLKRSIAYSTISQIGYMIMGVSAAAYSAGFFHLLTHAFFKALLFMGAGSVISAMAGEQSMDKMSGMRRAMPFTFAAFTIGALALAAFPGTAGYFSKGEILELVDSRGHWFIAAYVAGSVGALLTAFYSFRMVFRVFTGAPCDEAKELEEGHLHHAEPFNPGTHQTEDTDVGYPGADHHIAEREWSMKIPMAILAAGALLLGWLQVPFVDDYITTFLDPTFSAASTTIDPSKSTEILILVVDSLISVAGIGIAWYCYVRRPGTTAALIRRFGGLHTFLVNKWYFDQLYDLAIVRPVKAVGRFANNVFERDVVNGMVVGAAQVVRSGNSLLRTAQTGVLRYYSLLLIVGLAALALYFLLVGN